MHKIAAAAPKIRPDSLDFEYPTRFSLIEVQSSPLEKPRALRGLQALHEIVQLQSSRNSCEIQYLQSVFVTSTGSEIEKPMK